MNLHSEINSGKVFHKFENIIKHRITNIHFKLSDGLALEVQNNFNFKTRTSDFIFVDNSEFSINYYFNKNTFKRNNYLCIIFILNVNASAW